MRKRLTRLNWRHSFHRLRNVRVNRQMGAVLIQSVHLPVRSCTQEGERPGFCVRSPSATPNRSHMWKTMTHRSRTASQQIVVFDVLLSLLWLEGQKSRSDRARKSIRGSWGVDVLPNDGWTEKMPWPGPCGIYIGILLCYWFITPNLLNYVIVCYD